MSNHPSIHPVSLEDVFQINDISLLSNEQLHNDLSDYINNLIITNFERLIQLLYRIDVSEYKLKILLKEHPTEDAGRIIADLIIERQRQKILLKQTFSNNDSISEEERW